jgi:hypothetical protein
MVTIYSWISINAILMEVWIVNGSILVIFIGVPMIVVLVQGLRDSRIESFMTTTTEHMKNDIDLLNQITTL